MHRTTDPACSSYRPPRNRLTRWMHNRARGKVCRACFPLTTDYTLAEADLSEILAKLNAPTPGVGPQA